jgi:hypothetical protein
MYDGEVPLECDESQDQYRGSITDTLDEVIQLTQHLKTVQSEMKNKYP